jgi:hypothetical protein
MGRFALTQPTVSPLPTYFNVDGVVGAAPAQIGDYASPGTVVGG